MIFSVNYSLRQTFKLLKKQCVIVTVRLLLLPWQSSACAACPPIVNGMQSANIVPAARTAVHGTARLAPLILVGGCTIVHAQTCDAHLTHKTSRERGPREVDKAVAVSYSPIAVQKTSFC